MMRQGGTSAPPASGGASVDPDRGSLVNAVGAKKPPLQNSSFPVRAPPGSSSVGVTSAPGSLKAPVAGGASDNSSSRDDGSSSGSDSSDSGGSRPQKPLTGSISGRQEGDVPHHDSMTTV